MKKTNAFILPQTTQILSLGQIIVGGNEKML